MGANYDWISGTDDLVILGPTESKDGFTVTVQAQPSGVVWALTFVGAGLKESDIAPTLERLSRGFNDAATNPHVVGLYTTQEVNAVNQQVNLVHAILESSSGKTTRTFTGGYAIVEPPPEGQAESVFDGWVATRVAQLDSLEGA